MIKLRKLLNETPDGFHYGRFNASWFDSDAFTFGYKKRSKKFVINKSHGDDGDGVTHSDMFGSRANVKFPGRLWTRKRVISFWGKYPTPSELKQLLKDVSKALGIRINHSLWKLDLPTETDGFNDEENYDSSGNSIMLPGGTAGKLIPINKYIVPIKAVNVDTGKQHVAPPKDKEEMKAKEMAAARTPSEKVKIKAKYAVPKGVGSMRMKGNMPAAQYSKMRYPNVDENILPKRVLYSAVILNEKSQTALLDTLKQFLPQGWKTYAHHMTIEFGKGLRNPNDKGKNVELTANEIGISDKCVAVKVSGYDSANKIAHITLAVSPDGKPKDSNEIQEWQPIQPIVLYGTIEEIQ